MKKKRFQLALVAVLAGSGVALWVVLGDDPPQVDKAQATARVPEIHPDFSGVVIPPNIAPMNFAIREPGRRFFVRIDSRRGAPIEIASSSPRIMIPSRPWQSLLSENRGERMEIHVFTETVEGWRRYAPIENQISNEEIDNYLAYRRIGPVHNKWTKVGVYQRDLATYTESVVLDGQTFGTGCVNCHSFANNNPNQLLIGIRGPSVGNATILASEGPPRKIGTRFGYTSWHPSGRLAAFSINSVWQFFHAAGPEVRDVIDMDSALAYYRFADGQAQLVPGAADKQRLETYPTWSPDGRHLYYSSAPMLWTDRSVMPPERYAEVRYDLMKMEYDIDSDTWGTPQTLLSADDTGLSILQPRVSPDGQFLLFCMCQYGCFPVYQPTSDLYLMRLSTGDYTKLDINSEFSESWHSWSSNSRWIAFSSRRAGGFFTRAYLSYVDDKGEVHKPFVLPQRNPEFYDSLLETLSVPELVTGPVPAAGRPLTEAAKMDIVFADAITGATQPVAGSETWQPARE